MTLSRPLAEHLTISLNLGDPFIVVPLSRRILEQIVALRSEGILILDAQAPELPVVYVNPAYERMTGYCAEDLLGRAWRLLEPGPEERSDAGRLKAAIGRSEACRATVPDLRRDGTTWLAQVSLEPLHDERGELGHFLCLLKPAAAAQQQDAGSAVQVGLLQRELGRARQKLAGLEGIDPVTGVHRFEHFLERLRRDLRLARRDNRPIAVLMFEITELDAYRQTFGPKAADSCLRMVAAQVTGTLRRAGDLCARWNEQLIVAMAYGQDDEEARALAARITHNVRGLGLHNPRARSARYITVRSGVACAMPESAEEAASIVERARADLQPARQPPRSRLSSNST